MASAMSRSLCIGLVLLLVAMVEATTPVLAKEPKSVKCTNTKFKYCSNVVHVCPKGCPDTCTVDCASCQPICPGSSSSTSSSASSSASSGPPPSGSSSSASSSSSSASSGPPPSGSSSSASSSSSALSGSPPSGSSSSSSASSSSFASSASNPPPSTTTSSSSSSAASSGSGSSKTPSPNSSASSSSNSSASSSSPNTPSPSTSTPTHSSSHPPKHDKPHSGHKVATCKSKKHACYGQKHVCPASCPTTCEVDCVTCKPVCKCDFPGAVCQDPRFIGGDGITFYFHGKKDKEFCLITDPDLHINAHLIGKRSPGMTRDFTWVQSLGIMFDGHRLFVGAQKTATWVESIDRLSLTYDNEPIFLQEGEGATWQSTSSPRVTITRTTSDVNSIVVEVEGRFRINSKVVPITQKDSDVHKYGLTSDDCLAHLDLGFKFYSLSGDVEGVLGKTYRDDYVSKVNVGAAMPVLGGDSEYETTGLFSADCKANRFVQAGRQDLGFVGMGLKELEKFLS